MNMFLDVADAHFTFSIWCRSGLVGAAVCNCWRCRARRGEPRDEARAEREAHALDAEYGARIERVRRSLRPLIVVRCDGLKVEESADDRAAREEFERKSRERIEEILAGYPGISGSSSR